MTNDSSPKLFSIWCPSTQRGRLKVYIGAAAGVGKTYRMLEEAHQLRDRGVDVVLGFVETHHRRETEERIGDLEIVPRRKIQYREVELEEMDVDAIIARKPDVVIVDELAHTNAPGSRHPKRYQDVEEIVATGINVITAINIQHVESLNALMKRVTGIDVRETVPDSFLARADQIVNIDVPVEALRERLREGKIYPREQIENALKNFFKPSNLASLRELALREVARSLDRQRLDRESIKREGGHRTNVIDRIMVGLSSNAADTGQLLRKASRIAGQLNAEWFAVHIETPNESVKNIGTTRFRRAARQYQRRQRSRRRNGVAQVRRRGQGVDRLRARQGRVEGNRRPHASTAMAPLAQGRRGRAAGGGRNRPRRGNRRDRRTGGFAMNAPSLQRRIRNGTLLMLALVVLLGTLHAAAGLRARRRNPRDAVSQLRQHRGRAEHARGAQHAPGGGARRQGQGRSARRAARFPAVDRRRESRLH